ncbi:MAG: hypothetical protein K8W52_22460 [Deltaproteobacteria bacterium]|nr:hypothetical protein [Deltaproteobacteria bacterium]
MKKHGAERKLELSTATVARMQASLTPAQLANIGAAGRIQTKGTIVTAETLPLTC